MLPCTTIRSSDAAYPGRLRSLELQPAQLWLRGAWDDQRPCLAVVGSAMLFPLLTLVLMGLPGQAGADGELAPLPKPMIVAAPVIGVLLALLVSLVFSRLG